MASYFVTYTDRDGFRPTLTMAVLRAAWPTLEFTIGPATDPKHADRNWSEIMVSGPVETADLAGIIRICRAIADAWIEQLYASLDAADEQLETDDDGEG